jgi:phosphonatase-like hydrolase
MIRVVLFDVIGTTVRETYPDAINDCFEQAFADNQVSVSYDYLKSSRGKDKKEVIDFVVKSLRLAPEVGVRIYHDFKKNLENSFNNFSANGDAEEIFRYLKEKGIKVALGTGLPRPLLEGILKHLNWSGAQFDYLGIANEVGAGRPSPLMIQEMMRSLSISDPKHVLKVGDTVSDIEEGKNAGVHTAAILSGTQAEENLRAAKPDFVIQSLSEIRQIIP